MFDVYIQIVKDSEPELVRGVDIQFVKDIQPGDYVKFRGAEYKVEKKVFDLDDLDFYIYTEFKISDYHEALLRGQKLMAIKLYKESHGCSLMDAKQFIDALAASLKKSGISSNP